MKNVYSISTDQMDALSGTYNRTKINASEAREFISSGFQGMSNSGLFSKGIDVFSKQLDSLYSSLDASNRVVTQFSDSSVELELTLKRKANDLTVPTDFIKSDSSRYITIDDISLSKNDGKSVNEGEKNLSNVEFDNNGLDSINSVKIENIIKNSDFNIEAENSYSVNKDEKLKNILTGNIGDFNFDDDSFIKEKTDIQSIAGNDENIYHEDEESDINNSSIKVKEKISNINKNNFDFNFDSNQMNMSSSSSFNDLSSSPAGNYDEFSENYSTSTNKNNIDSNESKDEKELDLSGIFNEISQNYNNLINYQEANDSNEEI